MDILDAKCLVGRKQLNMEVGTAFSADLLSDVLAFAKAGSLLLTGLTNPQIVRTASILDIAAIILVRGKIAPDETLRMADELEIPMLSTRYILFETSGRLFMNGIRGCVERVGSDTYVTL
jgi:predicted transcriptional regulator